MKRILIIEDDKSHLRMLNVLLEKRKVDQIELEEKILLNVESLIKPYLDKLRQGNIKKKKKNILNIIQTNLDYSTNSTSGNCQLLS